MRTCLYRHYNENGDLLYVGVSLNLAARLNQHATTSQWFHQIFRVEVEWFDTREAALNAERAVIVLERPLFNKIFQSSGMPLMESENDQTRITLRVPSVLMKEVKTRAKHERRSLNSEIVQILRQHVQEFA